MIIDEQKLRATIIETKAVDQRELGTAVEFAKAEKISLPEALLQKDLISDENLGQLTADLLGFPFINLKGTAIPKDVLKIIPEILAKSQKIIAFERGKEGLKVAMADPKNLEIKEFIEKKVGDEVIRYFATERDLDDALALYQLGLEEEFSEIIKRGAEEAKKTGEAETPIIEIVNPVRDLRRIREIISNGVDKSRN